MKWKKEDMRKYVPYVFLGVVIGIIAYGLAARQTPPAGPEPKAEQVPAVEAVVGGETEAKPSTAYPAKALPYIESGYRFQFSGCHGTPGSLVVKVGKYFLLDNRDAKSRTFAFAGQTYSVGGYGAAVAAIWKPGTYNITCDGGGAATVTVQK